MLISNGGPHTLRKERGMKKFITLLFAIVLASSLCMAQASGGSAAPAKKADKAAASDKDKDKEKDKDKSAKKGAKKGADKGAKKGSTDASATPK